MDREMMALSGRMSLGNGLVLRLLSGLELLEARREAAELACLPGERPLCSNACLLARALWMEGEEEPLFADGEQVLIGLTAEEIEALCARWDAFRRGSIPTFDQNVERGYNPDFHLPGEVTVP
jgi:hypothetical protein